MEAKLANKVIEALDSKNPLDHEPGELIEEHFTGNTQEIKKRQFALLLEGAKKKGRNTSPAEIFDENNKAIIGRMYFEWSPYFFQWIKQ